MQNIEPAIVAVARSHAAARGFALSSEPGVGALLAALAAASPPRAHILELGTGAGVGLAWLVHGLGDRRDATVFTVDTNPDLSEATAALGWPDYVSFIVGDGADMVRQNGAFDLIFADAPGGKIDGLGGTIDALAPGGILVVDDMDPALHHSDGLAEPLALVRARLVEHAELATAECPFSSGVIIATKRR